MGLAVTSLTTKNESYEGDQDGDFVAIFEQDKCLMALSWYFKIEITQFPEYFIFDVSAPKRGNNNFETSTITGVESMFFLLQSAE